jgi:hypothetical protein
MARGICRGVFAVYKNISDGRAYLHLASRLEQCKSYSEDFSSVGMTDITDLSPQAFEKINKDLSKKTVAFFGDDLVLKNKLLVVFAYVGIDYEAFDTSRFSAVLHTAYHSGTANEKGVLYLAEKGVDVYLSPSKREGEVYDSLGKISKSKVKFLYGTTFESAWAKLTLAYSYFDDSAKIEEFLATECNFERIKND